MAAEKEDRTSIVKTMTMEINTSKYGSVEETARILRQMIPDEWATISSKKGRMRMKVAGSRYKEVCLLLSEEEAEAPDAYEYMDIPNNKYLSLLDPHGNGIYRNIRRAQSMKHYLYVNNLPQRAQCELLHQQILPNKKIVLLFYVYDITRIFCDAIINSTTENLKGTQSGLSRCLMAKAGEAVALECDKYIIMNSKLAETKAFTTPGGSLSCSHIIHTVPPLLKDYHDVRECQTRLQEMIHNCLEEALKYKVRYLAMPLIARNCIPDDEIVTDALWRVLNEYDRSPPTGKDTLREIHIVDTDSASIENMVQKFKKYDTGPSDIPLYE